MRLLMLWLGLGLRLGLGSGLGNVGFRKQQNPEIQWLQQKKDSKESTGVPPHISLHNFFAWHHHYSYTALNSLLGLGLCLGFVRIQKTPKPRAPMTLQLWNACLGENRTATTWIPPHLSSWHLFQPHVAPNALPRVRVTPRVGCDVRAAKNVMVVWADFVFEQCPGEAHTGVRSSSTSIEPQWTWAAALEGNRKFRS